MFMPSSSSATEKRLLLSYTGDGPKEVLAHNGASCAMTGHDLALPLQQPFQLASSRAHTFQDVQHAESFRWSSIVKVAVYLEW